MIKNDLLYLLNHYCPSHEAEQKFKHDIGLYTMFNCYRCLYVSMDPSLLCKKWY
jgi:hypothetical protein